MARLTNRIVIRPGWWVRPYLAAVVTMSWLMRPVVDDDVLFDWIGREVEFAVRHGMRCRVE